MPFVNTLNQQWKHILDESLHDFYHLPQFLTLEARHVRGKALGWISSDKTVLIPLISRKIPGTDYRDLTSPYGYAGILFTNDVFQKEAVRYLNEYAHEASNCGYISTFIRLNPIYNDLNLPQNLNFSHFYHGQTLGVDLMMDKDCLIQNIAHRHLTNIRRLCGQGFSVIVNDWSYLNQFIDAYAFQMKKKCAHDYYNYQSGYFGKMKELLEGRLYFLVAIDSSKQFAAGSLFTYNNGLMQYYLSATEENFISMSPSKLILFEAIKLGCDLKARVLHLGGGVGASTNDGLFKFKEGFGNLKYEFTTVRFVHDFLIYQNLCKNIVSSGMNHFFPAYRR